MNRSGYINNKQDEAYSKFRGGLKFQKDIENVYEEIDYKLKLADQLGKTVRISERQFPKVNRIIQEICSDESMECPTTYVYESYYYGAESYGINSPWIEISAKTIRDFSEDELRFILAREIYKIHDGVTKQRVVMEEWFKVVKSVAPNQVEMASRISFYRWYRLTGFSADNFGYLCCGSIRSAVNALLLTVMNSRLLVEQIDIKSFIGQASDINKLSDGVSVYTKADELVPYAPHRLQNLLAYAVSDRGMKSLMRRN